jgi:hypothetical protein
MTPKPAVVGFKGNHKEVLRIRFTRLKATPTVKTTAWGTRVVDHIDDSVTVPFGGNEIVASRTPQRHLIPLLQVLVLQHLVASQVTKQN